MGNLPAAAGAFYIVVCVLFLLLGTGFLTAHLFGLLWLQLAADQNKGSSVEE